MNNRLTTMAVGAAGAGAVVMLLWMGLWQVAAGLVAGAAAGCVVARSWGGW